MANCPERNQTSVDSQANKNKGKQTRTDQSCQIMHSNLNKIVMNY